jgi:hypothetical protein
MEERMTLTNPGLGWKRGSVLPCPSALAKCQILSDRSQHPNFYERPDTVARDRRDAPFAHTGTFTGISDLSHHREWNRQFLVTVTELRRPIGRELNRAFHNFIIPSTWFSHSQVRTAAGASSCHHPQNQRDVPLSQPTPVHHGSKSVDISSVKKLERVVELEEDDEEFQGRRYAEAQMPLPLTPPPESPKLPSVDPPTSDPEHQPPAVDEDDASPPVITDPPQINPNTEADPTAATIPSINNADGDAAGADVEALRQQLKRFKERFTGSQTADIDRSMLTS